MSTVFWNNLRSAQGVNISVTYLLDELKTADEPLVYSADSLVVNVNQPVGEFLTEASAVNAILFVNGAGRSETWELPLQFTGTLNNVLTFASAPFPCAIGYVSGTEKYISRAQIAVCIDGIWQQDPMQWDGCHNFNFDWLGELTAPYVLR